METWGASIQSEYIGATFHVAIIYACLLITTNEKQYSLSKKWKWAVEYGFAVFATSAGRKTVPIDINIARQGVAFTRFVQTARLGIPRTSLLWELHMNLREILTKRRNLRNLPKAKTSLRKESWMSTRMRGKLRKNWTLVCPARRATNRLIILFISHLRMMSPIEVLLRFCGEVSVRWAIWGFRLNQRKANQSFLYVYMDLSSTRNMIETMKNVQRPLRSWSRYLVLKIIILASMDVCISSWAIEIASRLAKLIVKQFDKAERVNSRLNILTNMLMTLIVVDKPVDEVGEQWTRLTEVDKRRYLR